MPIVLAVDAGTTGIRTIAFDGHGLPIDQAYRELTQHYPRPGWVEHDPVEIRRAVLDTLGEVYQRVMGEGRGPVAAIGITNQRETALAWDRRSGEPLAPAIVWQDRRTADRCRDLEETGHLDLIRSRTGLVLDSYFSATKWEWLLSEGGVDREAANLVLGTVDAWVLYVLTGGGRAAVVATDASNASRTLTYDIDRRRWDPELAALFHLPAAALPEVRPSAGRFGVTAGRPGGLPDGIAVSGMAGDQQAALFGQACFWPGMTKNTYGTGSFVLMNLGPQRPAAAEGLLTTVAWDLGDSGGASREGGRAPATGLPPGAGAPDPAAGFAYALEGSVFVTGAGIQWLRDGLGIISAAAETGPLAASLTDAEGVYFVPALTGLGSPWWDPQARGSISGLTRGSGRAHLARAVVEAMAYQTRDVAEAMERACGRGPDTLRVDGGASVMDVLLQFQADQLRTPVERSAVVDTTARGAAWLAGLAEGVWGSLEELSELWSASAIFRAREDQAVADGRFAGWRRALARARAWEQA